MFESNIGFRNKKLELFIKIGKAPKKIAVAGAGSPLKSFFLLCSISKLNFANLFTAASVNTNPPIDHGTSYIFSNLMILKSIIKD